MQDPEMLTCLSRSISVIYLLLVLTLWQADCFNQADCHGQINLAKQLLFFKNVLKGHRMKG